MDKETAVEIQKLKDDVGSLKKAKDAWDTLIKNSIVGTVRWLLVAGMLGVMSGWHMSENARKAFAEWISK